MENSRTGLALCIGAHLAPAAKAAGISEKIGRHTFRHTFATLLKANGEGVKTVQELLRDANSTVTMNVYTPGSQNSSAKRITG
ncbi:MAG: tyrosine-type recombinase/integrase [Silvibacterium sp.]